jgi:hypothetical protein
MSTFSDSFSVSWNGASVVVPSLRRYFGAGSIGSRSHFEIVFLESPVSRAISRSDFLPRLCRRPILPIMSMVITSRTPLHKKAAGQVKHLAQFSVGANTIDRWRRNSAGISGSA